jgi:septal ring factor EnvC (AmiA/AmiB activator)
MRKYFILFLGMISVALVAQTPANRTRELETQRKTLMAEIEGTNRLLSENKKTISSVLRNMSLVVKQIEARRKLIAVLDGEVRLLDGEIRLKEAQIREMDKDLRQKKDLYAASVRKMYEQKTNHSQLLFILSASDPAQSFRRMIYLKEYAGWRKRQSDEIVAQQEIVTAEREVLLASKKEKEALAQAKQDEENLLQKEENAQKVEVAGLQKNAKKLQAEMDRKKKQAAALNREIERIIAAQVAQSKKAAKADPQVERKAETKGGYAMTKEEQTLASSFAGNRGKLPFPLQGNYKIVHRVGKQQYADLPNTTFNSNGLKIQTTPGNRARAVFDGVVGSVFRIEGTLLGISILHGNYITLYCFIDQPSVKQGDKVKTGQDLGRIYTDSANDDTFLYFEIRKDQALEDPERWLNR